MDIRGVSTRQIHAQKRGATQSEAERKAVHSFQKGVHTVLGRRGWIIGKHEATLGPMRIDGKDHPLHDVAAWCERLRRRTPSRAVRGPGNQPWSMRSPGCTAPVPGSRTA